jgi:hypothetical protein
MRVILHNSVGIRAKPAQIASNRPEMAQLCRMPCKIRLSYAGPPVQLRALVQGALHNWVRIADLGLFHGEFASEGSQL